MRKKPRIILIGYDTEPVPDTAFAQQLHQVVGKRVVIVDEQYVHLPCFWCKCIFFSSYRRIVAKPQQIPN
jgi:hypothetical protein